MGVLRIVEEDQDGVEGKYGNVSKIYVFLHLSSTARSSSDKTSLHIFPIRSIRS